MSDEKEICVMRVSYVKEGANTLDGTLYFQFVSFISCVPFSNDKFRRIKSDRLIGSHFAFLLRCSYLLVESSIPEIDAALH